MMNLNQKFMEEVARTKDPVVFLGVAKVLGVSAFSDKEPKDFVDLFADVVDAYDKAGRKRKKELLEILKKANQVEGELDGNRTENTKA